MLNSTEYELKLIINVFKMLTIVRILTFMSSITSDNLKAKATFIFQGFSYWLKQYLFYNFNIQY